MKNNAVYLGLKIEPAFGEEGCYVSFWMSSDEWKAFKKLGLKKRLAKKFELTGTTLYADNSPYAKELRFFVKGSEWSEFESSRLFRELAAYAELLHREKERMYTALHEQECKEETQRSSARGLRAWFQKFVTRFCKQRKEKFKMNKSDFMTYARQLVVDYFNEHVDVTDGKKLTLNDVYIVWFSKTLQNWKALVSTTVADGMYYEITHNGDKGETYLDAYKKWDNMCIVD